jgi:hypothetical protein
MGGKIFFFFWISKIVNLRLSICSISNQKHKIAMDDLKSPFSSVSTRKDPKMIIWIHLEAYAQ